MIHIIEKSKTAIATTLLVLTLFTSCNKKDDLEEIFTDKEWKLAFIENETGRNSPEKQYTLKFEKASFTFSTPSQATISGNWYADGKSRDFGCSNIITTGRISGDEVAKEALNILRNAHTYEGDANYLKIKSTNNNYMQFHNK